jgi:hypothetical protein
MPSKIAKLWVNHASMTGDPSAHVAYLINGHQLEPGEQQSKIWTKSLPKTCKQHNKALIAHWHGIYERFKSERATPGSMVHHNAKVTARQFVINLPNDISDDEVHKLAKAVLQDFPRHIPVSMVLHRTSNRGKRHTHLQGLFSYRNGGYGGINDQFRLDITSTMKWTVHKELTDIGYQVDMGTPGGINSRERRWLNAQGSVEQRRNPRYLASLAAKAASPRLQAYCTKRAEAMRARVGTAQSVDAVIQTIDTMALLQSIYPIENTNRLREQPSTCQPQGTEPLTQEALEKALLKARLWNHSKTITKSI